jgi:hypothetical protein
MFDQQAIRQSDPKMQLVSIPPALLSTQQTRNRLRPRQLTTQGKTVLSLYADAPNILIHL